MRSRFRAWWPAGAWMGVILAATTITVPATPLSRSPLPLDRLGHFLLYLGLGWALGRGMWRSDHRTVTAVLVALAAGIAFAGVDEWHQTLLPAREASVADWLLDVAGVSLGLVLYLWPRAARSARTARGTEPLEVGE